MLMLKKLELLIFYPLQLLKLLLLVKQLITILYLIFE